MIKKPIYDQSCRVATAGKKKTVGLHMCLKMFWENLIWLTGKKKQKQKQEFSRGQGFIFERQHVKSPISNSISSSGLTPIYSS